MSKRERAPREPAAADWVTVGDLAAPRTGNGPDGVGAIQAADPAFAPAAFLAWSASVHERALKAWSTADPEPLRPVMAEPIWVQYSKLLLVGSGVALGRRFMASARAVTTLLGAGADERAHSMLIGFGVALTDRQATSVMPADRARWQERWLFQRPAGSCTHPSGAVAVCLVCGGPAKPEDSGNCPYCHANITTRTAGWLVTALATTQYGARKLGPTARPAGWTAVTAPLQPPPAVVPPQPPRAG